MICFSETVKIQDIGALKELFPNANFNTEIPDVWQP